MPLIALLPTLVAAGLIAGWMWWLRNASLAHVRGMKAISILVVGNLSLALAIGTVMLAPAAWPVALYVWALLAVGSWIYLRRN